MEGADTSAVCVCRYHSSSSLRRASFRGKALSLRLCHIYDLLKHFTQAEEILEYACDYCHTQQHSTLPSAKRSLSLVSLPNVLRLHIKRFRYVPPCLISTTAHIKYTAACPLQVDGWLILQDYTAHQFPI